MNKGLILLALSLLLITACQPVALTPEITITPTATNEISQPTIQATSAATATLPASGAPTPVSTLAFTASGPATCEVVPILQPLPENIDQLFPSVTKEDWSFGPQDAKLTIIEYGDFQCPFCAKVAPVLKILQALFPDDVRVIYRHFPLTEIHANATLAAQAAEAAGLQEKFWEMHDMLYETQSEWSALNPEEFKTWLHDQAKNLNLISNQFSDDLISDAIVQKVAAAELSAKTIGLSGTPTLLFNKYPYQDRNDLETLTSVVNYFLLSDKGYTACPEMTIDPSKTYTATIKTDKGDVVVELYPKQAPWAVNSFVFLAKNKWFDNSTFFRVIPGFVLQAGDPSNSGLGNPGYMFSNEVTPELRFDKPGVLALANSGTGVSGSQFFITYTPLPELDGKYTIFGQVISGMNVLSSLRPRNSAKDVVLLPADPLISITIEEK
jgi:cyclophilin family peptidyl-prolyl cis-trans isomerase/protein-disulfide isomerase